MRRRAFRATLQCACAIALLSNVASAGAAQPAAASDNPAPHPAVVEQPRAFGYLLGDVLTQRVLLRAGDADFAPVELPAPRRLNVWFERRTPRVETSDDGRRWLRVDYQVVNSPQSLATVALPAWTLESNAGAKLRIPAWQIKVTALTPATSYDSPAIGELRPDRRPLRPDLKPVRNQLLSWSLALLATLGAWVAWVQHRNYGDRLNRPFARALQEIESVDDATPDAWRALHRAFDRTAGRVVQIETLPMLFVSAPYLEPLRSRIQEFFEQSSERFFGNAPAERLLSVRALCRELRQVEKRCAS